MEKEKRLELEVRVACAYIASQGGDGYIIRDYDAFLRGKAKESAKFAHLVVSQLNNMCNETYEEDARP